MHNKPLVHKLAEFNGHKNPIYCLTAAPEPGRFFSAGGDKMIVEWNMGSPENGTPIARFPFTVYSLCTYKNVLLAGTSEGGLHILDLASKNEFRYFQTGDAGIFDIVYSETHHLVAASTAGGTILFINPDDLNIIKTLRVSSEKIRSIAFNTHRKYLYAACADTRVYVIDLEKLETIFDYEAHTWSCNVVYYDPENDHLITASKDAHLRIWDIKQEFELIKSIPAHNYAIYQISYNPARKLYLTASRDKTLKLWDKDLEILCRINKEDFDGHINSVNTAIWLNENQWISAGDDRRIIAWEISAGS